MSARFVSSVRTRDFNSLTSVALSVSGFASSGAAV
jgi:hypothetical protein